MRRTHSDPLPRRRTSTGSDSPGSHEPDEPDADPESVARAICLRLLTARARTRTELARELNRRRVPADAAEAVLRRLSEVGLVDDAAFASAWVSSRRASRGLSRAALVRELTGRGVDRALASLAVEELDPDTELATARDLVRRRLRAMAGAPREVQFRRLQGLLARKGYPAGFAARVVTDALRESIPAAEVPAEDETEIVFPDGEE